MTPTPRSSGAPTAGYQARAGGTRHILTGPGKAGKGAVVECFRGRVQPAHYRARRLCANTLLSLLLSGSR